MEVDHGPVLIDGNDFLSDEAYMACSQNVAFTGNRIRGSFRYSNDSRKTPLFEPHSVELRSLAETPCGNGAHVFVNNILARDPVFAKEAHQSRYEDNWTVPAERWKVDEATGACTIDTTDCAAKPDFKPVDSARLGGTVFVGQAYPEPAFQKPRE